MADKKISALTAATTPLAGTEVLPIVQSGATVKVAVSDLTAGRAISATQLTLTAGNVIPANGFGIDFSATPGTGTSELLADYEEGTWTPSLGGTTTYNGRQGFYTKIGRSVFITLDIDVALIGTGATARITNLPFTPNCNTSGSVGFFTNAANSVAWGGNYVVGSDTSLYFTGNAVLGAASANWNIFGNGTRVIASVSYIV